MIHLIQKAISLIIRLEIIGNMFQILTEVNAFLVKRTQIKKVENEKQNIGRKRNNAS